MERTVGRVEYVLTDDTGSIISQTGHVHVAILKTIKTLSHQLQLKLMILRLISHVTGVIKM